MCGTRGLRHDDAEEEECPQEWGHGSLKGYATPSRMRRLSGTMLPILFATYGAVFVAEIAGDKLLYTTGVLATRYRTAPILCGMAIAFMAKMGVALPHEVDAEFESGEDVFAGRGDVRAHHRRLIAGAHQSQRTRFGVGENPLAVHGDPVGARQEP